MRILGVVLVGLALFVPAAPATAQEQAPSAPHALYFEFLGNGLLYSLNYDHRFRDELTGRIGAMYLAGEGTASDGSTADISILLLPVMVNRLFGDGAGRFELGLGPMFVAASGSGRNIEGVQDFDVSAFGIGGVTSTVGYRYQPEDGGFVFRIGLTPFWSERPQLWGGLSLGVAF